MAAGHTNRHALKAWRDERGWSYRELASRIQDQGVSVSYAHLCHIEHGSRRVMRPELLAALAAALGVQPEALVNQQEEV